jgi:hypothetical protein
LVQKRPILLYLLVLALALLCLANGQQAVLAIKSLNWLTGYGYFPSALMPVFSGIFFMLLFLTCLVALWLRQPFAPLLSEIGLAVYWLWSWVYRLWITMNPRPFSSQLFSIGFSLALILLAEFSLYLMVPYMHQPDEVVEKE